jgi:hypothetical protein
MAVCEGNLKAEEGSMCFRLFPFQLLQTGLANADNFFCSQQIIPIYTPVS